MTKKTDIWMPLYIGDYIADTSRLNTEQHGAYLLLIMDYWRSGRLPDDDQVLAQITKLSPESWKKHKGILRGFFEASNGELIHPRIEKELGDSKKNLFHSTCKSILGNFAKYGTIDPRVYNEQPFIEWWATVDQTKYKSSHKESPKHPPSPSPSPSSLTTTTLKTITTPDGVSDSVFKDYVQLRNKLKAPVTTTAIKGLQQEANKAGMSLEAVMTLCCQNGWRGFKADWVKGNKKDISFKERDSQISSQQLKNMMLGTVLPTDSQPDFYTIEENNEPRLQGK